MLHLFLWFLKTVRKWIGLRVDSSGPTDLGGPSTGDGDWEGGL